MGHRLPIVLSITALFVAVLGFTSVGEAAKNVVLGQDTVGSKQLKNKAVGSNHLKKGSVGSGKLRDNTILSGDIRDGQVSAADLKTGAVTSAAIATGGVTTADLGAKSVTTAKLAGGPTARVANSANVAVATGAAFVPLPFNLERFDVSGMHNATTNTSRLTIATPGIYLVGANVSWSCPCPGHPELSLRVTSGATVTFVARVSQPSVVMLEVSDQSVTTLVSLKAGDYVEAVVRQTGGGSANVVAAPQYSPEFWATWVAPA